MKYKVGDEVLVKAKVITGARKYFGVEVEDNRFDVCENNVVPVPDMTAEEAWKLAIKLRYMDFEDKIELFNLDPSSSREAWLEIMENMSPESVRDKIERWEAEKNINVGDEVAPKSDPNNNECKFVVTNKYDDEGIINGFSVFDGDVFSGRDIKRYQNTGRHIDIDKLLKQIGGDE